jgi:hypothetical protein
MHVALGSLRTETRSLRTVLFDSASSAFTRSITGVRDQQMAQVTVLE